MEQILDLPSTGQRNLSYAGFWIRAAALIIDGIIMYAGYFAVLMAAGGFMDPTALVIAMVVMVIGSITYFIAMESSAKQATLGKMAVGIKVGTETGEKLSAGQAAGRYFGKILSGMILYIGYMMAGWDPKKQALHDKLAGTYVFYAK